MPPEAKNQGAQRPFPRSMPSILGRLRAASFLACQEGVGTVIHLLCTVPTDTIHGVQTGQRGTNMSKRHKMPQGQSRKHFTRHAMRAHPKNMQANPMRGGIRL